MSTLETITRENLWGKSEALDYMGRRHLDTTCPPLKSYLYPGARVLDMGCGPGAMTLEVAGLVYPGSVTGIDLQEMAVAYARRLAEAAQISNVSFAVGDAQHLDLADASFDLTYALNMVDYLPDPVQALREYKRVTVPGGRVVTTLANAEGRISYPAYPAWETYRKPNGKERDNSLGRKFMALYSEAGFTDIKVEAYSPPEMCVYPGAPLFESWYNVTKILMDPEGPDGANLKARIAAGSLSMELLLQAQRDLDAWYQHPHAFNASIIFLASGRVP
ncbi:MAG: methyltransferase domain-containing protein [Chloroflexi bacterium]|nr:methyltransferase domain-containing protein [Chloroflexota bacterium]